MSSSLCVHLADTNWTKDKLAGINIATNPIVNGTSDDPSTAWKTPHGEWRLIGNAKAFGQNKSGVAPIYAAADFTGDWHLVGDTPFPSGECPSFFPLPRLYPGTTSTGTLPTHVHKVRRMPAFVVTILRWPTSVFTSMMCGFLHGSADTGLQVAMVTA